MSSEELRAAQHHASTTAMAQLLCHLAESAEGSARPHSSSQVTVFRHIPYEEFILPGKVIEDRWDDNVLNCYRKICQGLNISQGALFGQLQF